MNVGLNTATPMFGYNAATSSTILMLPLWLMGKRSVSMEVSHRTCERSTKFASFLVHKILPTKGHIAICYGLTQTIQSKLGHYPLEDAASYSVLWLPLNLHI
ncbi:hypothetical protein FRC16_002997 [Serendipita sp. 398]|nr:hypothetical protein FRC16_002997 [Serendipita sp. 398]